MSGIFAIPQTHLLCFCICAINPVVTAIGRPVFIVYDSAQFSGHTTRFKLRCVLGNHKAAVLHIHIQEAMCNDYAMLVAT